MSLGSYSRSVSHRATLASQRLKGTVIFTSVSSPEKILQTRTTHISEASILSKASGNSLGQLQNETNRFHGLQVAINFLPMNQ